MIKQLPQALKTIWTEQGYEKATPIQTELYEPLLAGVNVIGISPTGSGKTVAYLLPLLQRVKAGEGNQLLVLLPSQELAIQVTNVAKTWGDSLGLKIEQMIGGANKKRQIEKLKQKPEVIIGTVGRVSELMQDKKIKAHTIQSLVLDEADQLLQPTELQALGHIFKAIQRDTQLIAISATDTDIATLLEKQGATAIKRIDVTDKDTSRGNVTHGYLECPSRKRGELLRRFAHMEGMRGIVFFNQVQELGVVSDKLRFEGILHETLASDQNKMERQLALQGFETGKVPFLLTTDVAARGIDFQEVPVIIQYDVAFDKDIYTHRSGRTGRMGHSGYVLTFVGHEQEHYWHKLCTQLELQPTKFVTYKGSLLKEEDFIEMKEQGQIVQEKTNKKTKKKNRKDKGAPKSKHKQGKKKNKKV